jgi:hypothetical protein
MNKMPKEKRDKVLLVALGTGGILVALYLLVISSQQSAWDDCSVKIDSAKDKVTKAERWLRMGASVRARLESGRKDLEVNQEDMAPIDKFKWFYNTLEKALATHAVKLVDITRDPELGDVGVLPKFPFQAATFGVKLSARYEDFGNFLAEFENRFPYLRVKNLEIEPESVSKSVAREGVSASEHSTETPESLAITLRVVTLVKPAVPL